MQSRERGSAKKANQWKLDREEGKPCIKAGTASLQGEGPMGPARHGKACKIQYRKQIKNRNTLVMPPGKNYGILAEKK